MLIAMVKSGFCHIQKWRLYSGFKKKLRVKETPLDFYENRPINTVFHADYDGAIFFRHIQNLGIQKLPKFFFWG